MEITLKNQFITLWNTYFPQAGLPITFQYSADTQNLPIVEAPKGHRCIIAQLTTGTAWKNSLHAGGFCGMPGWKTVHKLHGQDVSRIRMFPFTQ